MADEQKAKKPAAKKEGAEGAPQTGEGKTAGGETKAAGAEGRAAGGEAKPAKGKKATGPAAEGGAGIRKSQIRTKKHLDGTLHNLW